MSIHPIVHEMMKGDAFSQWLGIEIISAEKGFAELRLSVRPEMLNGFGIAHGGITYSLADSALAFAANSAGKKCVSIETSISHTKSVSAGEILTAIAKEDTKTSKTAFYSIRIQNASQEIVALFKGVVYNTGKDWDLNL